MRIVSPSTRIARRPSGDAQAAVLYLLPPPANDNQFTLKLPEQKEKRMVFMKTSIIHKTQWDGWAIAWASHAPRGGARHVGGGRGGGRGSKVGGGGGRADVYETSLCNLRRGVTYIYVYIRT